jgi:hypothetical protein
MDINDINVVSRVWTVEEIKDRLQNSNKMVSLSLIKIYEKQTEDERSAELTKYRNGMGFNAKDAKFGTSLAKVVERGGVLSERQIDCARRILIKYSGQLTKIANSEAK